MMATQSTPLHLMWNRLRPPATPRSHCSCSAASTAFVSCPAHLWRLGRERPIERVTARAEAAPNAKRLTLRPPCDASDWDAYFNARDIGRARRRGLLVGVAHWTSGRVRVVACHSPATLT